MNAKDKEKQEAIQKCKEFIKPNDKIYCVLRHVSSSGMSRRISFYVNIENKIRYLDWYVEKILDYKRDTHKDGVKVSGCGMDMGFAVVYELGKALWPDGTDKPHGMRNGEPDNDGGYALKHQWV